MRKNGSLRLSPTDLNAFLACEHLTTLQLAVARGELDKPWRHNPHADLIRRKGEEHEAAYLARLRADGRTITDDRLRRPRLGARRPRDRASHPRRRRRRLPGRAHRRHLARVRGLRRAPRRRLATRSSTPSSPAAPSRSTCSSSASTPSSSRGSRGACPRPCTSSPGSGERESFRPDDYFAYYRRLRARFLDAVERRRETYPYPVDFCALCEFISLCKQRWDEDDHLTLVAGMSRIQVERLPRPGSRRSRRSPRPTPDTKVKSMRATHVPGPQPPGARSSSTTGAPASTRSSSCRRSRTAASRFCRSRARATSGSTSRATRGSSRRAGSST